MGCGCELCDSAATVFGTGSLPGSAAPGQVSAPFICSFAHMPDVGSLAGGPSAVGPSGLSEHSRESPRLERRRGRVSIRERSHSSKKRCRARSPPPSLSSRMVRSSASASSASSDVGERGARDACSPC